MFNLFRYTYKLVQTDKPDIVYLVPTAETYLKAFAPGAILAAVVVAGYAYAAYVEKKNEQEAVVLDFELRHPE